jgi:hypothetical protein
MLVKGKLNPFPTCSASRWSGVTCCDTAKWNLLQIPCSLDHEIVFLDLTGAGLSGTLPPALNLPALLVLKLGENEGLGGNWPPTLELRSLMVLQIQVPVV